MPFWMILPYFLGLVLLATIVARSSRSFRMTFILFADWVACTHLAGVAGSQTEWIWLAVIDGISASLLLTCQRRMEAALAVSFVAEVVIHLAYGFHDIFHILAVRADVLHWWSTFGIAWGQAISVVAWGCWNGRKGYRAPRSVDRTPDGELRSTPVGNRHIFPLRRERAD
jgi:hypothetical protein